MPKKARLDQQGRRKIPQLIIPMEFRIGCLCEWFAARICLLLLDARTSYNDFIVIIILFQEGTRARASACILRQSINVYMNGEHTHSRLRETKAHTICKRN